ncbi:hypothetical protein BU23DRAFT_143501 [Bimuria novae-zelandiae CBS 107.79]|uniref:Uncharacterized protein n=1 Tax=Bimuria novae-zelandiae CBS 107.79 TaxID=1447943 RepID=A0A6A5V5T9_9PLEO|nr:hypothetical protein BU23DRAFT_143501 [Bimuria novae-zelandiae CBS 107.79]
MQKVPSKYDKQAEPSPSVKTPHKRHVSKDSVTSANMAFISRRRIDPKTEQELRAACALILQNFKPSDHDIPDADPKLDFRGPHRRREHRTEMVLPVTIHRPTGAPAGHKLTHDGRNDSQKLPCASKSYPDLPMRANTGKRRVENTTEHTETEDDIRRLMKSTTADASRQPIARTDTADTDDVLSIGTPLTASTDNHMYSYSTAPTSVAVTHRSSKRTSRQGDNPAATADAQAAEWMRQELEKRRQQIAAQPELSRPQTSERPPSRAASIRSGIRDYIFPGSRALSRTQSQSSLNSQSSSQPKRSSSAHGWRSWGLNRMSSSRNSSRPGTSGGRKESGEHDKKSELNLNRELPPLPSLDTWKEPEKPKEQPKTKSKTPVQGAHIATMMRAVDHQQQSYAAVARQHHRRSDSDSMATRYANAHGSVPARIKSPTQQAFAQKSTVLVPEHRSMDFDHMVSAMTTAHNFDEQLQLRVNEPTLQRRSSNLSRLSVGGRPNAPNFSRKISTDGPQADRPFNANEFAYPNSVQITATNAPKHQPEQKSRLKKVFSAWVLKKERKGGEGDWMQKFEKEGIKTGVMTQDQAAFPPVVRY